MRLKRLLLSAFVAGALAPVAHAENSVLAHFRVGMAQGSFSGPASGSYSVLPALDFEYEIFKSNRSSTLLRMILAMDLASAKVLYSFAGGGQRYYLGSKGMKFERVENGIGVTAEPTMRFFIDWNAGISQVIVKSYTASLQVISSMLDVGAGGGMMYQVSKNIGIDLNVGASFGYGFSSVAVTGINLRFFTGMCYFF